MSSFAVPAQPPFALRARLLSALPDGDFLWLADGVIEVDEAGRIRSVRAAADAPRVAETAVDLRPLVVMPGLVDTHVHIPQIPAAGLGAGMDLLAWLERYVFSLERAFDVAAADELAPQVYRAMAAAGTTTFSGYAAVWPDSTDACFRAAEEHGIRAIIGNVLMDRVTYDDRTPPGEILENAIRASGELCERWHGAADGRLRYAFTPRFAVSCSADMLRESASLAEHYGAIWQTHLSEDAREMATVAEHFPEARDYLDVYDRGRWPGAQGAPGPRHPPLRPRGRAHGRDRFSRGPLSGQQHVHPQRRDAHRALPRRGPAAGPGHGRGRRSGAVGHHADAPRLLPAQLQGRGRG